MSKNDKNVILQKSPIYVPGNNKKRIVIETQTTYEELVDTGIMDEDKLFEQLVLAVEQEILNQFEEIKKEKIAKKDLKVFIKQDEILDKAFGGHISEEDKEK